MKELWGVVVNFRKGETEIHGPFHSWTTAEGYMREMSSRYVCCVFELKEPWSQLQRWSTYKQEQKQNRHKTGS
jgi:hypothetical protein